MVGRVRHHRIGRGAIPKLPGVAQDGVGGLGIVGVKGDGLAHHPIAWGHDDGRGRFPFHRRSLGRVDLDLVTARVAPPFVVGDGQPDLIHAGCSEDVDHIHATGGGAIPEIPLVRGDVAPGSHAGGPGIEADGLARLRLRCPVDARLGRPVRRLYLAGAGNDLPLPGRLEVVDANVVVALADLSGLRRKRAQRLAGPAVNQEHPINPEADAAGNVDPDHVLPLLKEGPAGPADGEVVGRHAGGRGAGAPVVADVRLVAE